MKTATFSLELITPCFCAGADQAKAEIRAPAIRGQLRWWFRTLGGFKSLAPLPVKQQEARLFGSAAGDDGTASALIVRVTQPSLPSVEKSNLSPEVDIRSATGYFLFPLRNKIRGALESGRFELSVLWRGSADLWPDIRHLITVFSNLGSIGFRSRRGYGAIAPTSPLELNPALAAFSLTGKAIVIRTLPSSSSPLPALSNWFKGWRSHGRSGADLVNGKPRDPANMPGFNYAKADHDAGYGINNNGPTYRAALGLPIIQRCGGTSNNWEVSPRRGEGRFASPIILRPHRAPNGKIFPLVIFVNAHAWLGTDPVYLNGRPRTVSLDLYEAMLNDPRLQSLPT